MDNDDDDDSPSSMLSRKWREYHQIIFQIVAWSNKFVRRLKCFRQRECGTVDRPVASDTRGAKFESSQRQQLVDIYLQETTYRKV